MSNPISEAQLAANRANAQKSSGARTEEGKAKSSLNAVKTGLTGRTVLLPSDDAAIYQQHLNRHFTEFAPATDREKTLVQFIADTEWRLLRIAPLEAGILAVGRLKLADQFAHYEDPDIREALTLHEINTVYRKDLNNLALQERRLRNQYKSDMADLKALQDERRTKEKEAPKKRFAQAERAFYIAKNGRYLKLPFDFAEFGFDFSVSEIDAFWEANTNHHRLSQSNLDFDRWLAKHRSAPKAEPQAA
jgi:hypothetical protein